MAATYTKPAKVPRWNDDLTNNTEPAEGYKDVGWAVDVTPPSSYENWRSNLVGQWLKWIDERFYDGATKDDVAFRDPGNAATAFEILSSTARVAMASGYDLVPKVATQSDCGVSGLQWGKVYTDTLKHLKNCYYAADLSSGAVTIDNTGPVAVTPDANKVAYNATETSKQVTLSTKGKYQFNFSLVVTCRTPGPDTVIIDLRKNGSTVVQTWYHYMASATQTFTVTGCWLGLSLPGDYWEIMARSAAAPANPSTVTTDSVCSFHLVDEEV